MTRLKESTLSRIIYLSQLFDPEPTFKGHSFVTALEKCDFEVEVVTGFPNYPGGKVYEGYRIRAFKRDLIGKTAVTRLAMYPSHDRSALRRIATYFSFMITSFFYLTFCARRAGLIYVYYPALTAGLAAVMAGTIRRTPVVLDVQDMWPDSLGSSGMMRNRIILWLSHVACNFLYRRCKHIIVLSPGFKDLLIERGVPDEKITILYNWADEAPLLPPFCDAATLPVGFQVDDRFRILFAGNIGEAQSLDVILDAADVLAERQPGCVFYLMGEGTDRERLEAKAKRMKIPNLRFLPRVPLADVQGFLAAADALLVHLPDDPLFRVTIPSKTQAYLYAGRPVLMGVMGNAADLVREADAGYEFMPEDSASLVACVEALIADGNTRRAEMGRNGHNFYMQTLRRDLGILKTAEILDRFYCNMKRDGSATGGVP